jgi:hypothetical protein
VQAAETGRSGRAAKRRNSAGESDGEEKFSDQTSKSLQAIQKVQYSARLRKIMQHSKE